MMVVGAYKDMVWKRAPAPKPLITRAAMNCAWETEATRMIWPTRYMARPIKIVRRRPRRSAKRKPRMRDPPNSPACRPAVKTPCRKALGLPK